MQQHLGPVVLALVEPRVGVRGLEVALVLLALVLGLLAAGELTWRRPAGRPG